MNNKFSLILLIVVLFFIAFIVRLGEISFRSIWMDEDRQAMYCSRSIWLDDTFKNQNPSAEIITSNIIDLAASQQQPPLDYYLEAIGISFIGLNEMGVRIHAVFFGAFTCFLFFLCILKYYGKIIAFFGFLLICFNPWLIRYSAEGRPYSVSVFCVILFIFSYYTFVKEKNVKNGVVFTISQFILLCSIGFQPIVMLFVFGVTSAFLGLFFVKQKIHERVCCDIIPYFAALGLFYPIFSRIKNSSTAWFNPFDQWMERAAGLINEYSASNYFLFYDLIGNYNYLLFLAVPVILLTSILQRREASFDKKTAQIKTTLLLVMLIYPVICWFMFGLATKGADFKPRYVLTYIPIMFFVVVIGLKDFLEIIERKVKSKRMKNSFMTIITLGLLLLVGNNIFNARAESRKLAPADRSWRDFYAALKERVKRGDALIMETLIDGGFTPDWHGEYFYFNDEELKYSPLLTTSNRNLILAARKLAGFNIPNQKLFFAFASKGIYKEIINNKENFNEDNFKHIYVNGLTAIEYYNPVENTTEAVISVFEHLLEILPHGEATIRLVFQLTEFYWQEGDFDKVGKYLNQLKELDRNKKYAGYIDEKMKALYVLRINRKLLKK